MDSRSREVTIGAACSVTATLAQAAAAVGRDPFEYWVTNVDAVVQRAIELQGEHALADELGAVPANPIAIPGTTPQVQFPVQAPPVASVTANVPPVLIQQPAPAPAPIPGTTDGDPVVAVMWTQFFQDFNAGKLSANWYDNRGDIASGAKKQGTPQFKRKSDKEGLWSKDKKNPSWVAGLLAQAGLS